MPGTNNFIQFNPGGANMESDTAYSADAQRSGGLASPAIFTSALGNKLFYQTSTFIAAFAQALATKNYNLSDASLSTLAGVLANVMTLADMSGYAPLSNPVFTGTPTAPTPAGSDNSAKLATTAFIKALAYATLANPNFTGNPTAPTPAGSDNSNTLATTAFVKAQGFQSTLGYTPVQQGGGANQSANKLYLGWDGGNPRLQVDVTDVGKIPLLSQFAASFGAFAGYTRLPNSTLIQWGTTGTNSGYTAQSLVTVTFPIAFSTTAPAVIMQNSNGGSYADMPSYNVAGCGLTNFQFAASTGNQHGAFWIAIGS